jgi:streptomycin 6-kinase
MSFEPYLSEWKLEVAGESFHTHSSDLLPVRHQGRAALLKLPHADEERQAGQLMDWWQGHGAAEVYAFDQASGAIVLERLASEPSLKEMAMDGRDDEAMRILCQAAGKLHSKPAHDLPPLFTLERWFRALAPMAARYGGILQEGATLAERLLADQRELVALHGDLHHENLLWSEQRGWLAIDPKGLYGERSFDYANLLRDPDFELAAQPRRFAQQSWLIAQAAGLDHRRLLEWALAITCLSAAWYLEEGNPSRDRDKDLIFAHLAAIELEKLG